MHVSDPLFLLCACGCAHAYEQNWHTRMKTCVCQSIFSVVIAKQAANSPLWPLTHSMLCNSPSCCISLGRFVHTPYINVQRDVMYILRTNLRRGEEKVSYHEQQRDWLCGCSPVTWIWFLTSLWPFLWLDTVCSAAHCLLSVSVTPQGLQTTVPQGRTTIISSSNSAVNDLTHEPLTTAATHSRTHLLLNYSGFHTMPKSIDRIQRNYGKLIIVI